LTKLLPVAIAADGNTGSATVFLFGGHIAAAFQVGRV
jgi:hypothetical protein